MPENKGLYKIQRIQFLFLLIIFTLFSIQNAQANVQESGSDSTSVSKNEHSEEHATTHEEGFNPGTMILDHVKDAHDWHIMDINGHAISVPLPVIIYDNGLNIFSSSKFEHGHATVESNGNFYKLHNGKVYKTEANGELQMNEKGEVSNVKPLDFSITKNVFALLFGSILILIIFLSVANAYKKRGSSAPKGLQSFLEPLILFMRDEVIKPSVGKHYAKFLPLLLTIFFFIFINNLMGLIPIFPFGANLTGNIAVTMVLAVIVFFVVNFSGNKHYWKHIFMPDVPVGLWILLIPIEILGVVLKPFVLMLRLFANITAGHIIILGFFSLIFIFGAKNIYAGYGSAAFSVAFTLFMSVLELLVAFLQAYVFTLLASLYIGSATEEHHHAEEHH
ncbi:MAG: F0F1 ATP synthase subunit A [Bacteroidia bacterium]|nr:F0F1 ATP synthase subunit A [Bacteroidia bacterium]